jgi:outer membrane lipoprotein SlyB
VRLQNELSSDTAEVEQRFEATTVADLYRGSDVLIPAGSLVRGIVSSVNKASRTDRKGSMTLAFDQITVRGRTYPMRATVVEAIESEGIKGEIGKIGTGGAVGAIIGGIIGGAKGALIGVLVGAGGTIAATEGKDVTLPSGTLLRVRLDQPPSVR